MILHFRTKSGSEYKVDLIGKTWERLVAGSHGLRDECGTYTQCNQEVMIGVPFTIICPPRIPGSVARYITTTPVTEILSQE